MTAEVQTADALADKSCVPCEGGVPNLSRDEAQRQLQEVDSWELSDDARWISRKWTVKDFMAGMDFLNDVAKLAEDEGHHPDVRLTGYRNVGIELTTHAIDGLSENDFILAAKINRLPVEEKE